MDIADKIKARGMEHPNTPRRQGPACHHGFSSSKQLKILTGQKMQIFKITKYECLVKLD